MLGENTAQLGLDGIYLTTFFINRANILIHATVPMDRSL